MAKIRNTHIICTLGPATESVEMIRSLLRRGMNMARFNFSHGTHDYHAKLIGMVREAAAAENVPAALILDTKGPEIRTGAIRNNGTIILTDGETVEVAAAADAFTEKGRIIVSYDALADDIRPGAKILIADGLIALECLGVENRVIRCRVTNGGELGSQKNVNIVGVHTRLPAISEKDMADLKFGHEQGMDYVAASFIRKARDVTTIQQYLRSLGSDMPVISKIEDEEGLLNIVEIIRVSAGVMVARGDMGVQIPAERVPLEQKRIISLCNKEGKPVITATQMLDSMIRNPRPTRAEAADVANAILDGTDCVMLSGETAGGAYPEAAVEVMDAIARAVEASDACEQALDQRRQALRNEPDLGHIIAGAASDTADRVGAACLIVPTVSGLTAQMVSKHRPCRPILAASFNETVRRRLLLYWGVIPLAVKEEEDSEATIQGAIGAALREGYVKNADKVVVTAGIPVNSPFTTNSIRVHVIGNILGRGLAGFGGRCTGRILKAATLEDASRLLRNGGGEILLTHTLDESFIPIIRIVDGIILEGNTVLSKDMIRLINPNVTFIARVPDAMKRIEERLTVTLDGKEKIVYEGIL